MRILDLNTLTSKTLRRIDMDITYIMSNNEQSTNQICQCHSKNVHCNITQQDEQNIMLKRKHNFTKK